MQNNNSSSNNNNNNPKQGNHDTELRIQHPGLVKGHHQVKENL